MLAGEPARPVDPAGLRAAAVAAKGGRDVRDRCLLGLADRDPVLTVGTGDRVREHHNEAAVAIDLLWRGLLLERRNRAPDVLEAVLLELLVGVVARVVDLRLGRDDLIQ